MPRKRLTKVIRPVREKKRKKRRTKRRGLHELGAIVRGSGGAYLLQS